LLDLDQARRMKDPEKKNNRLKRLVADLSLEKQLLKDIAEGTYKPSAVRPPPFTSDGTCGKSRLSALRDLGVFAGIVGGLAGRRMA
jgi:hypothetical protein